MSPLHEGMEWTRSGLGDALAMLGGAMGSRTTASMESAFVRAPTEEEDLELWLDGAVDGFGLEVIAVDVAYSELDTLLDTLTPAIVPLGEGPHESFLLLLRAQSGGYVALCLDGSTRRIERRELRDVLCSPISSRIAALDQRLMRAGVPRRRRMRVLDRTLGSTLSSDARIGRCWLLRPPSSGRFMGCLRREGVLAQLGVLLTIRILVTMLFIAAWAVIGSVSFGTTLDSGVVFAWGLLLGTVAVFQIIGMWLQKTVSIHANRLLRQRLLKGSFHLDVDEMRSEGAGRLFGRAIDADRLHGFAVTGGFEAISGIFQILGAAVIVALDPLLLALVGLWAVLVVVVARRVHGANRILTRSRISLTHDTVDGMVGYRTRLVQELPAHWHRAENLELVEYLRLSKSFDRVSLVLSLLPGAWQVTTFIVLGLRYSFGANTEASLWIPLGGVLLAYGALRSLADGIPLLSAAAMAWEQVEPLVASLPASRGVVDPPRRRDAVEKSGVRPLLELQGVHFGYVSRPRAVLSNCGLAISRGDRLLLEGPSGGGKSTLGALIAGLRSQSAGTILLDGLDRHALGFANWRRRVVSCPQFHENHVFSDTFAFNLLMSRSWPPSVADLEEAQDVCEDLGLGPLLDRMPLGIQQMVGESGWRLSHGEQSRLFIARALLTQADVLVLDESFAALDPETLQSSVDCVFRRCATVIAIAHP